MDSQDEENDDYDDYDEPQTEIYDPMKTSKYMA